MKLNWTRACGFASIILICSGAGAGTSRIDNEFFAFRMAPVLAVKDGLGWKKNNSALMGMKNGKFTLDFEGVAWVPAPCRQALTAALPKPVQGRVPFIKMPVRIDSGDSGHALVAKGKGCEIGVWLTGATAADRISNPRLSGIPLPGTPSVNYGVLEFRAGQEVKVIEFVIGVDDV